MLDVSVPGTVDVDVEVVVEVKGADGVVVVVVVEEVFVVVVDELSATDIAILTELLSLLL